MSMSSASTKQGPPCCSFWNLRYFVQEVLSLIYVPCTAKKINHAVKVLNYRSSGLWTYDENTRVLCQLGLHGYRHKEQLEMWHCQVLCLQTPSDERVIRPLCHGHAPEEKRITYMWSWRNFGDKKLWRLEGDLTFLELFAIQFLGIQFSHIQRQNLKLSMSMSSLWRGFPSSNFVRR
jgi:hypothetical protein